VPIDWYSCTSTYKEKTLKRLLHWRRRIALLLAFGLLAATVAPVNAYGGYEFNRHTERWDYAGYYAHIPVCLHSNFDGPTWDLSNPKHARANDAIGLWNAIGADIYLYRTNSTCQYLHNNGTAYVQIGFGSAAWQASYEGYGLNQDIVRTGSESTLCDEWEPFRDCRKQSAIWLNPSWGLPWSFTNNAPRSFYTEAEAVIVHELGHIMELNDQYGTWGVMGNYANIPDPIAMDLTSLQSVLNLYGSH